MSSEMTYLYEFSSGGNHRDEAYEAGPFASREAESDEGGEVGDDVGLQFEGGEPNRKGGVDVGLKGEEENEKGRREAIEESDDVGVAALRRRGKGKWGVIDGMKKVVVAEGKGNTSGVTREPET